MTQRLCAVVPSHNHFRDLPRVVNGLRAAGLFVFIIDDASGPEAEAAIAALHDPGAGVAVTRLAVNQGKGGAVSEGLRLALAAGFTHAAQVDADGQHDLGALPALLAAARANPDKLIVGCPVYGPEAPLGRRLGRKITDFWVMVETRSRAIQDAMCGFRVYPLASTVAMIAEERPGLRMDFDIEVLVRLVWRGVQPVNVPVAVCYPEDNSSNFRMLRDNLMISWMHTRLVTIMVFRLILGGSDRPLHWAGMAERGAYWGLAFVALAYGLLGRAGARVVLAPIVLYFHLTGAAQRRASARYLGRVLGRQPGRLESYDLALDFALRALEALGAWSGRIGPGALKPADPDALARLAADPGGRVLLVSHHGNAELARALMAPELRRRLVVLTHTRHAENYNRLLRRFQPEAGAGLVQVTELGPEVAMDLKAKVEAGAWIAIAADRVPVLSRGRVAEVPFLGRPAPFSQGPYILASLLDCPVSLLFCTRQGDGCWRLELEDFADRIVLARGRRAEDLAGYAARYGRRLEAQCRLYPGQWYNFYDFWHEDGP
jgi:predicted LPLAT superfamily acyltransferase/glycosyltransferase involved in cell wall biosynthesis